MGQTEELLRSESRPDAAPLMITVTPWGAFAAAALVVSAAALLFTLGRRYPQRLRTESTNQPPASAEWQGRLPTVDYEQLKIDRGARQ